VAVFSSLHIRSNHCLAIEDSKYRGN